MTPLTGAWPSRALKGLCALVCVCMAACDAGSPIDGSYFLPTAVIGVPVESPTEANQVRSLLSRFGARYSLHRYRVSEDPNATKRSSEAPYYKRQTDYIPDPPNSREGFVLVLMELSPQCFVIEFSERSGIWSRRSLDAFQALQSELAMVTRQDPQVLIRPKREQNYPERNRLRFQDPELPSSLGEYCTRMGLPDPHVVEGVQALTASSP